jgi:hypothetical protein
MKTLIRAALAAMLWICMLLPANACDICGCSIGNNNPFLFPNTSRHFIGLSWYHRSYELHAEDGSISNLRSSNLLLNAQYAVSNRFRFQAMVPYIMNRYSAGTGDEIKNGIGDISILGNYTILSGATGSTNHLVTITGGVKLATASATPSANPVLAAADLQTGSGSTDFITAINYLVSRANWRALAQVGYRYNTQDGSSGLRFGDVTTASLNIYHKIPVSAWTVTPYISGSVESRMDDARSHALLNGSGGTVSLVGAGLDVNTRKIAIGISCLAPVTQSLANGAIYESPRLNTHVFFTL